MTLVLAGGTSSLAAEEAPPEKQVEIILVPDASFEQLMAIPEVRALARAGGAGLMSANVAANDEGTGALVTLGAGARSAGPPPPIEGLTPAGGFAWTDIDRARDLNGGSAVPGLLGSSLGAADMACVAGDAWSVPPVMDEEGRVPLASLGDVVSFDGGCSIVATTQPASRVGALLRDDLAGAVEGGVDELLVIVLNPVPTSSMRREGDDLPPIVMAEGDPSSLLGPPSSTGGLVSDTTHQVGVVSNEDVAPTVLSFLGIAVPPEMKGHSIGIVAGGEDAASIHRRYLAHRRMAFPLQVLGGIVALLLTALVVGAYVARDRLPGWLRACALWGCFAAPVLATAMHLAGELPALSYISVGTTLVLATAVIPALVLQLRPRGMLVPPLALGVMVLAAFVLEWLNGFDGMRFTFIGSTLLDGGRFYGLPNATIGLLLGSAAYVAASLRPWPGYAVLALTGMFAGLPWAAANLGAAVTLFAAAGIWIGVRMDASRWKRIAAGIATPAVGTALVLLAHRLAAAPTHGTRFVETTSGDPLAVAGILLDRLGIGIELLRQSPTGIAYLVATPILLWLVIRPRGRVRVAFEAYPQWRAGMLTILWGCVVAYFANDTGVSAVGMGFAMALGGVLYVPLASEPAKMEPT